MNTTPTPAPTGLTNSAADAGQDAGADPLAQLKGMLPAPPARPVSIEDMSAAIARAGASAGRKEKSPDNAGLCEGTAKH